MDKPQPNSSLIVSTQHAYAESDDESEEFKVLSVLETVAQPRSNHPEASEENPPSENSSTPSNETTQCVTVRNAKLAKWIQSVATSDSASHPSFTDMLRNNKNFRNPAIFQKMISYCGIDEFGTHFKNTSTLSKGDFYKDICEVQDALMKN